MKPITTSKIEHQLARHDRRARNNGAFPATDHFFRPQPDGAPLGRARSRPSERARSAFRRMTSEMLAKHERIDLVELTVFGIVIAITAWPLVSLLIVLAQTTNS
jgi:hypothetical protein